MSDTHSENGTERLLPLLLVALVPLLACFPPETRGEALVGSSILIGLAGLLGSRGNCTTTFTLGAAVVSFGLFSATIGQALSFALWPLSMGLLALTVALAARRVAGDPRLLGWIIWALALSGSVVALHALYQRMWGFEALWQIVESDLSYPDRAAVMTRLARGRAFATFATPAALGGYLSLTLPASVSVAMRGAGRVRWTLGSLCLLQAGALFATASASATVALIAALALAFWRIRGVRRRLLPIGIVLSLLLLAVVWVRGERVINMADRTGPLHQRAGNIRVAAAIAWDHPWLGAGPGSYAEQFPRHRIAGDNESRHAHNIVAELIADWGIPVGVALSLLFFTLFLRPLWRSDRDGPRLPLAIGLAAFAVQNLADFSAFMPSLLWTAALVVGALSVPRPSTTRRLGVASVVIVCALILAVSIASGTGWATELRHRARTEAFAGRLDAAIDLARTGARRAPWSAEAAELLASLEFDAAVRSGDSLDQLATRVDRLIEMAPARASARALRARLRLKQGDSHGAWVDLRSACRLYPREESYCRTAREWDERLGTALDGANR